LRPTSPKIGDVLEIVNVIEGHRDIAALFGEDE